MMQEMPNTSTAIFFGPSLGGKDQMESPWNGPEVEVCSLPRVVDHHVADSHPSTWRRYCDGRLRQFRASR
jgi:hypothetical protein